MKCVLAKRKKIDYTGLDISNEHAMAWFKYSENVENWKILMKIPHLLK